MDTVTPMISRTREAPMKITSAEFVTSAVRAVQYPDALLPEVAFVGRSNVGKSSLINTLANRRNLAKTSNTPGRTQLVNFFVINKSISFVDLPGYGYAKVPLSVKKGWQAMVEEYLETRQSLRLVVLILDIRREPSEHDDMLIEWLRRRDINVVFVLTEADKLSGNGRAMARRKIREHLGAPRDAVLPFSAKTRSGRDDIWRAIETACLPVQ